MVIHDYQLIMLPRTVVMVIMLSQTVVMIIVLSRTVVMSVKNRPCDATCVVMLST